MAFAQHEQVSQQQEPVWVQENQPNFDADLPEDATSGFYFLLADKQEHLGTDQSYRRFTYKILNSVGIQNMSDLSIDFDPAYQQVTIHKINIVREGGVINRYDPGNIQVVQRETSMERKLYDGRLTIIINLSDVRAGDIVDYSYTITGSNPFYGGKFSAVFALEFNIDAYQHSTSIIVPRGENFRYNLLYDAKAPEIERAPRHSRYSWEDFDLKAKIYEERTPMWYEDSPAVEMTQFGSWDEVNTLFLESFTLSKEERHQVQEQAKKLFKDAEGDKQFIEQAIRFVQDEVRYLGFEGGTNSHVPSKPSDVIKRRYGDCKDKSFLLSEILQSRGINAYPVLVHSYNGRNLAGSFPSPDIFDHCVVQIDLGAEGIRYIDPTIREQGGDLDKIFFPDYGYGLVIKSGTTGLLALPGNQTSRTRVTETFELDAIGGGANLLVETVYDGETADIKRRGFMETSLQTVQKEYVNFYSTLYPGIRSKGEMNFEDDRKNNRFTVYESYRIDSLWTPTGNNTEVISAQFYPLSMESFLYPEKSEAREMPYFLDHGLDVVHKTIVYVPVAWNITNEKRSVKNDYFKWDLDIRYKNAALEITHSYQTFSDHVAAVDVAQFLADHDRLQQDLRYFLTFNKAVAGAAEANSTSWAAVLFLLVLMAGGGIVCYLIYRKYDLPVKVKAKYERKIGGWLALIAIGLVFSPFMLIYQLLSGNYFSSSIWLSLFSSPETYTMGFLLGAELALYSLLLILSVFVLLLFFQRRSIAPRMMIILYGSNFLFSAIIAFVSIGLHPEAFPGPERQDIYFELSKMGIGCLIIIPYLLYSTRVEETFTRTRRTAKEPLETEFAEDVSMPMMR